MKKLLLKIAALTLGAITSLECSDNPFHKALNFTKYDNEEKKCRALEEANSTGANINAYDPKKNLTPLTFAITRYWPKTTTWLLAHGANPNQATPQGQSPLQIAIDTDYSGTTHALIQYGADPTCLSQEQQEKLQKLKEQWDLDTKQALIGHLRLSDFGAAKKLLQENTIDLNKKLTDTEESIADTVLKLAEKSMIDEEEKAFILLARHGAQGTQYDAVRAQNDPCVAALTAKFKASKTRQHYTTALSWALTEWAHTTWQPNTDDQTALATLLNLHTPKDYINYRQITSAATESNNDLLLRLILSNQYFCQYVDTTRSFMGIPSDLTNAIYLKKDKTTAVWLEKEKEPNYYVLQLLIQAGASLDKLLSYCTGFTLNRIKKTETKGNFLLEKVFPKIPSPYDRDSRCDLLPVASLLIAQGCTSTHQDETGDTVLNYALRNGCHQDTSLTQFFTEVFKMGRKIDPRIPGDNRLLREAIELKRRNLAALLMENGALTYEATLEKNYNGDTLLDLAVLNGDDALLQRCLALRPDLTPDADTNLLLHAVQTNNEQVIGLIIKEELAQKATKVTDSAGNTVFNLALEKKNYDLFKRLLTIRRLDGRIEPDSKVLSQVHKLKDPALKALVDENWNTEVDDFSEAAASSDARTVAGLLAQDTTYGLANMHNRNFENKTALRLALTTDMPPKNPDIPFLKAAKSEFVRKQKTVQTLLTNNACATEKHTGQVKKKITTYRKIDDHLRTINDPHYHEKHTIITEIIHILEEMNALLKDYFNYEMD